MITLSSATNTWRQQFTRLRGGVTFPTVAQLDQFGLSVEGGASQIPARALEGWPLPVLYAGANAPPVDRHEREGPCLPPPFGASAQE